MGAVGGGGVRYHMLELNKLWRRPGGFPDVSAYALDRQGSW